MFFYLLQEIDEKDKMNSFNDDCSTKSEKNRKPRRLFDDNDKALNVNEANIDFHYDDSSDEKYLTIEIKTYKHLDTSSIDLQVLPTYLRYDVLLFFIPYRKSFCVIIHLFK